MSSLVSIIVSFMIGWIIGLVATYSTLWLMENWTDDKPWLRYGEDAEYSTNSHGFRD